MSIRVTSDPETDRLLSLRASSQIPLPPEIALADPRRSADYFRLATFYDAYGLSDHPMVRLLEKERIDTMMSNALARSQHLDRVAHYGAWLGNEAVVIEDLTHPEGDAEGRAVQTRRGWFPRGGAAADIENFGNRAHNKSAQTALEVQQTITKGKPI